MLTKMLAHYKKQHLEMNIFLFDPVPGNLITSAQCDIFHSTLTNQCMDMSESINLNRVLAVYPYIPLPDMAFHAPIVPKYPAGCQVEEDVTLGCHQGALFSPNSNLACRLSFFRIYNFLTQCGTMFDNEINTKCSSEQECFSELDGQLDQNMPSVRYTHSWQYKQIVRHKRGIFLNKFHEQLVANYGIPVTHNPNVPKYMLDIVRN